VPTILAEDTWAVLEPPGRTDVLKTVDEPVGSDALEDYAVAKPPGMVWPGVRGVQVAAKKYALAVERVAEDRADL
jgi:hypothetical protein